MTPSSQEQRKQLELELNRLQREIDQFRVDSQRFFGGDLNVPPEELKERIAANLRRLRALASRSGTVGSFRLNSLESTFNSQLDLYGRRLREQETGGKRRLPPREKEPDPMTDGVIVGRGGRSNAVETLYKGLYLRQGQRSPSMDLEKFRGYIEQQTQKIRQKTGADGVQFRIAMEDGKMKLKAKPVKG